MQRFKKILFVADESAGEKNALTRAANLAVENKAKLTLLDVLDLEEVPFVDPATMTSIQELHDTLLKNRRAELERMRKTITSKHAGLRVAVEVVVGKPAVEIIRAVLVKKADLVIKAPQGSEDVLSALFGSTDLKLMRKCPCPVWISKPSRKKLYKKIVAAVDMNPVEPETQSLAQTIMAISTSLAKNERSELHVVHVWRLPGETKLRGRNITTTGVDKLVRETRNAHKTELESLLKHYPYKKTTVHLLKGRAGELIPPLVKKLDADLVVIGTVGRSGIPGFFIGNTAEKILNDVNCSVLTLKPEGFETPIQV